MAKLTDVELAALNLMIEGKKAGTVTASFIDNIVNDANNLVHNVGNAAEAVAKVTAAAAAVAAVAAGAANVGGMAAIATVQPGQQVSLEFLMRVRELALNERKR